MPQNLEITDRNLSEFMDLQEAMLAAKAENATKTYDILKKRYTYLKAMLNVAGVNLADIDKIKE